MPNHSPKHMKLLTERSAAQRRANKLAKLITTSPVLSEQQGHELHTLLDTRIAAGGA